MAWIAPKLLSAVEAAGQKEIATMVSWFVVVQPWIFRHPTKLGRRLRRLGQATERWHPPALFTKPS
jgi:hypothetical protein